MLPLKAPERDAPAEGLGREAAAEGPKGGEAADGREGRDVAGTQGVDAVAMVLLVGDPLDVLLVVVHVEASGQAAATGGVSGKQKKNCFVLLPTRGCGRCLGAWPRGVGDGAHGGRSLHGG